MLKRYKDREKVEREKKREREEEKRRKEREKKDEDRKYYTEILKAREKRTNRARQRKIK